MDFILVAKENDTDQRIYVPPIPPPLPPSLLVDGNGDPFLESHRGQRLFSSSPCGPISSCLVGRTMAICFGGREFESHRGQRFFDPLSLAQKVSIFWGIIHHFNLPYSNHYICLSIRTIRDELQQRPNCMYHILVFIYTCITFISRFATWETLGEQQTRWRTPTNIWPFRFPNCKTRPKTAKTLQRLFQLVVIFEGKL